MSALLRYAVPGYVALLLVLAWLGAANQGRLDRELSLMDAREQARTEIVDLRARAAAVRGPLAVSRWAQEHGMVPAPEIDSVRHVLPVAAPVLEEQPTGTEVRTVWR